MTKLKPAVKQEIDPRKPSKGTVTRFTTTIASTAIATLDQVPVSITPYDLWMKHIMNTPNLFLSDIIIAYISKIVPENIRNSKIAMLEVLENHNYGEIQSTLNKLDPAINNDIIEMLEGHRRANAHKDIATRSKTHEDQFINDIAKYISEAMQCLQYALAKISQ